MPDHCPPRPSSPLSSLPFGAAILTPALALGLSACCPPKRCDSEPRCPDSDEGDARPGGESSRRNPGGQAQVCEHLASRAPVTPACDPDHVVGPCNASPGHNWETTKMLSSTYCAYQWAGKNPQVAALGRAFIPDCPVSPLGNVDMTAVGAHVETFDVAMGRVEADDKLASPVTLAIIDFFGPDSHGDAIGAVAWRAAGCDPNNPCPKLNIKHYDLPAGARASDVGLAVEDAVEDWRLDRRWRAHPLVINLSIGWVREEGYEVMSPYVLEEIERARCRGALVLAASGNSSINECDPLPIEPADWERVRLPLPRACRLQFDINAEDPEAPYTPLVYSINAVDEADQMLLNHRPGTGSRIAALGSVALPNDTNTAVHGPLQGSSVSTAVASGISALAWSRQPTFSADALMHNAWRAGEELSGAVEVSLNVNANLLHQRRLRACEVIAGLEGTTVPCPSGSGTLAPLLQANPSSAHHVESSALAPAQACVLCGQEAAVSIPNNWQPPPPDPQVNPQPTTPMCPYCDTRVNGIPDPGLAVLQLDSSWSSYAAIELRLTIVDDTGNQATHIYNDPALLAALTTMDSNGQMTVVSVVDPTLETVGPGGGTPTRAWVEADFTSSTGGITDGNAIPVYDLASP